MVGDDELVKIAVLENRVDVARLHPRAQVLHQLIGIEDVTSDLVAKANLVLGTAKLIQFGGALLELHLIQAAAQDLHCERLVLELAALVLAGNHRTRGNVRDPHGRVGGVDALAAVTRRVIDVDAKVLGVDVDLDVIRKDREHLDTGERRLTALLLVRWRDAHQAMHALLGTEHAVCVVTVHGEGCMVNADDLCLWGIVHVYGPPASVTVAQVHAEEHVAPVLRLKPALARRHRHDGVTVVEVVGKPAGELKLGKVMLEGGGDRGRLCEKVVVRGLLAKLERSASVVELGARSVYASNVGFCSGETRHGFARGVGVIPEARGGALLLELSNGSPQLVDMKVALNLVEPSGQGVERGAIDIRHGYLFLPWQFLNFLPLPQGQGSFLPTPT